MSSGRSNPAHREMAELNFMDKHEYARLARREHFYFWNIGRREILKEAIARNVPVRGMFDILDMGCGPGGNILTLGEFGVVTGLDISEDALQFARDRGFKELIQGDVRRLPFPDHSFDLVSCLDVLEHIDDDAQAIREAFRVLKPGGIFLATVPAHPWLWSSHDEALHHLRRYTTRGITEKIIRAGFEIREHSHFVLLAVPINFLRRTLGALRKNEKAAETYDREFSGLVNAILLFLLRCEKALIRFFPLPFGSSLFVVTRKS